MLAPDFAGAVSESLNPQFGHWMLQWSLGQPPLGDCQKRYSACSLLHLRQSARYVSFTRACARLVLDVITSSFMLISTPKWYRSGGIRHYGREPAWSIRVYYLTVGAMPAALRRTGCSNALTVWSSVCRCPLALRFEAYFRWTNWGELKFSRFLRAARIVRRRGRMVWFHSWWCLHPGRAGTADWFRTKPVNVKKEARSSRELGPDWSCVKNDAATSPEQDIPVKVALDAPRRGCRLRRPRSKL